MTTLRFVILQVMGFAGLVALYMMGPLAKMLAGGAKWYVMAIAVVGVIGLMLTAAKRINGAVQLQILLPVIAVIAMQYGIQTALEVMGANASDLSKAVGGFFSAMSVAFNVSIAALVTYAWLRVTLWLTHEEE